VVISTRLSPKPRTLVLTHLTPNAGCLPNCGKLWDLQDVAFAGGRPFERRASLLLEGSRLPLVKDLTAADSKVFSWSGRVDDYTLPPGQQRFSQFFQPPLFSAAQRGIAGPGHNQIIFGGGNLDYCLFRTVVSVIQMKIRQNEPLYAAIPLALTYYSERVKSPIDYVLKPNEYTKYLSVANDQGEIGMFRVNVDDETILLRDGRGPLIELNFYTVFKELFNSLQFFPELRDPQVQARVFANFCLPLRRKAG